MELRLPQSQTTQIAVFVGVGITPNANDRSPLVKEKMIRIVLANNQIAARVIGWVPVDMMDSGGRR